MVIEIVESDVSFRRDKIEAAVERYKQLAEGAAGQAITPARHCSSCRCHESLDEIFRESMRHLTSYPWGFSPSGSIDLPATLIFADRQDTEYRFWLELAKWVQNGGWIVVKYDRDDQKYRIYFDSGKAYIQNEIVSWPASPDDEDSEEIYVAPEKKEKKQPTQETEVSA